MNFQPLRVETLDLTQQVAAELFPWEHEHAQALAAAVAPDEHTVFREERGFAFVRCWTAHLGSGPVCGLGILHAYRKLPHEVWLGWFGLQPSARGFGGGSRFLDLLIAHSRAEGCRTFRLWTTDEKEYATAATLYARRGFVAEEQPALPGEAWRTLVYSLDLAGGAPLPWSAVLDRPELAGREVPSLAACAA